MTRSAYQLMCVRVSGCGWVGASKHGWDVAQSLLRIWCMFPQCERATHSGTPSKGRVFYGNGLSPIAPRPVACTCVHVRMVSHWHMGVFNEIRSMLQRTALQRATLERAVTQSRVRVYNSSWAGAPQLRESERPPQALNICSRYHVPAADTRPHVHAPRKRLRRVSKRRAQTSNKSTT